MYPSSLLISAITLSIFTISSSPALLDLKNTFLAGVFNFLSSIISKHFISNVSLAWTGAACAAATGAAATGAAATGIGISSLLPSRLFPSVILLILLFLSSK